MIMQNKNVGTNDFEILHSLSIVTLLRSNLNDVRKFKCFNGALTSLSFLPPRYKLRSLYLRNGGG